ncbi:MAG: hypothetical protein KF880_06045 [Ferruginibacter sp.]|nr:hypothetical protein [Ferruginibacter sp.]
MMQHNPFHPEQIFKCTDPNQLRDAELFEAFTQYIQHLINKDFDQLVQLLYRIDVDESKLKKLLQSHESSAEVIAQSIIQRIIQTLESKAAFKQSPPPDNDAERW